MSSTAGRGRRGRRPAGHRRRRVIIGKIASAGQLTAIVMPLTATGSRLAVAAQNAERTLGVSRATGERA